MKIILALAAILSAAPAGAVLAQQTGRVPVPPPPRPGTEATSTPAPIPTAPSAAAPVAPTTTRPSAIPMPTQRPPANARAQQTTVLLELETGRPEGKIAVAIYRDADSFRRNRNPVRVMMLDRDRNGPITRAYVQGLTPGRYAIAAFQDIDGDGALGKGAFGIPNEPFGFSNDARGRFGPPTFDAAAFTVSASGTTQRIILRNPMNAILR